MKLMTCAAAIALLAAGCTQSEPAPSGEGNGILTVTIKAADAAPSRALLDGSTLTDAMVQAFENRVANFTAYVFNWNTGDLEAQGDAVLDGTSLKATITGLNTAGTKRILVIANGENLNNSSIPAFVNNPNYERLADGYIDLRDQSFTNLASTTEGFLMTGENPSPLQLNPGESNNVIIPVERVVAKVQLGEISFDSGVSLADLANFSLSGASIQRAIGTASIGTDSIVTPAGTKTWYGGVNTGSISTAANTALGGAELSLDSFLRTLLTELTANIPLLSGLVSGLSESLPLSSIADQLTGTVGGALALASNVTSQVYQAPAFWYVLPNADPESPTLLTLKGSYEGTEYYYPIEINTPASNPSSVNGVDNRGQYIERNTIYKINVTFHGFVGTDDPDEPGKMAALTVTVEPQNWVGPIIQNTTW